MSKNKKFDIKLTYRFRGITTNGFMVAVILDLMDTLAKTIGEKKQIDLVSYSKEDLTEKKDGNYKKELEIQEKRNANT